MGSGASKPSVQQPARRTSDTDNNVSRSATTASSALLGSANDSKWTGTATTMQDRTPRAASSVKAGRLAHTRARDKVLVSCDAESLPFVKKIVKQFRHQLELNKLDKNNTENPEQKKLEIVVSCIDDVSANARNSNVSSTLTMRMKEENSSESEITDPTTTNNNTRTLGAAGTRTGMLATMDGTRRKLIDNVPLSVQKQMQDGDILSTSWAGNKFQFLAESDIAMYVPVVTENWLLHPVAGFELNLISEERLRWAMSPVPPPVCGNEANHGEMRRWKMLPETKRSTCKKFHCKQCSEPFDSARMERWTCVYCTAGNSSARGSKRGSEHRWNNNSYDVCFECSPLRNGDRAHTHPFPCTISPLALAVPDEAEEERQRKKRKHRGDDTPESGVGTTASKRIGTALYTKHLLQRESAYAANLNCLASFASEWVQQSNDLRQLALTGFRDNEKEKKMEDWAKQRTNWKGLGQVSTKERGFDGKRIGLNDPTLLAKTMLHIALHRFLPVVRERRGPFAKQVVDQYGNVLGNDGDKVTWRQHPTRVFIPEETVSEPEEIIEPPGPWKLGVLGLKDFEGTYGPIFDALMYNAAAISSSEDWGSSGDGSKLNEGAVSEPEDAVLDREEKERKEKRDKLHDRMTRVLNVKPGLPTPALMPVLELDYMEAKRKGPGFNMPPRVKTRKAKPRNVRSVNRKVSTEYGPGPDLFQGEGGNVIPLGDNMGEKLANEAKVQDSATRVRHQHAWESSEKGVWGDPNVIVLGDKQCHPAAIPLTDKVDQSYKPDTAATAALLDSMVGDDLDDDDDIGIDDPGLDDMMDMMNANAVGGGARKASKSDLKSESGFGLSTKKSTQLEPLGFSGSIKPFGKQRPQKKLEEKERVERQLTSNLGIFSTHELAAIHGVTPEEVKSNQRTTTETEHESERKDVSKTKDKSERSSRRSSANKTSGESESKDGRTRRSSGLSESKDGSSAISSSVTEQKNSQIVVSQMPKLGAKLFNGKMMLPTYFAKGDRLIISNLIEDKQYNGSFVVVLETNLVFDSEVGEEREMYEVVTNTGTHLMVGRDNLSYLQDPKAHFSHLVDRKERRNKSPSYLQTSSTTSQREGYKAPPGSQRGTSSEKVEIGRQPFGVRSEKSVENSLHQDYLPDIDDSEESDDDIAIPDDLKAQPVFHHYYPTPEQQGEQPHVKSQKDGSSEGSEGKKRRYHRGMPAYDIEDEEIARKLFGNLPEHFGDTKTENSGSAEVKDVEKGAFNDFNSSENDYVQSQTVLVPPGMPGLATIYKAESGDLLNKYTNMSQSAPDGEKKGQNMDKFMREQKLDYKKYLLAITSGEDMTEGHADAANNVANEEADTTKVDDVSSEGKRSEKSDEDPGISDINLSRTPLPVVREDSQKVFGSAELRIKTSDSPSSEASPGQEEKGAATEDSKVSRKLSKSALSDSAMDVTPYHLGQVRLSEALGSTPSGTSMRKHGTSENPTNIEDTGTLLHTNITPKSERFISTMGGLRNYQKYLKDDAVMHSSTPQDTSSPERQSSNPATGSGSNKTNKEGDNNVSASEETQFSRTCSNALDPSVFDSFQPDGLGAGLHVPIGQGLPTISEMVERDPHFYEHAYGSAKTLPQLRRPGETWHKPVVKSSSESERGDMQFSENSSHVAQEERQHSRDIRRASASATSSDNKSETNVAELLEKKGKGKNSSFPPGKESVIGPVVFTSKERVKKEVPKASKDDKTIPSDEKPEQKEVASSEDYRTSSNLFGSTVVDPDVLDEGEWDPDIGDLNYMPEIDARRHLIPTDVLNEVEKDMEGRRVEKISTFAKMSKAFKSMSNDIDDQPMYWTMKNKIGVTGPNKVTKEMNAKRDDKEWQEKIARTPLEVSISATSASLKSVNAEDVKVGEQVGEEKPDKDKKPNEGDSDWSFVEQKGLSQKSDKESRNSGNTVSNTGFEADSESMSSSFLKLDVSGVSSSRKSEGKIEKQSAKSVDPSLSSFLDRDALSRMEIGKEALDPNFLDRQRLFSESTSESASGFNLMFPKRAIPQQKQLHGGQTAVEASMEEAYNGPKNQENVLIANLPPLPGGKQYTASGEIIHKAAGSIEELVVGKDGVNLAGDYKEKMEATKQSTKLDVSKGKFSDKFASFNFGSRSAIPMWDADGPKDLSVLRQEVYNQATEDYICGAVKEMILKDLVKGDIADIKRMGKLRNVVRGFNSLKDTDEYKDMFFTTKKGKLVGKEEDSTLSPTHKSSASDGDTILDSADAKVVKSLFSKEKKTVVGSDGEEKEVDVPKLDKTEQHPFTYTDENGMNIKFYSPYFDGAMERELPLTYSGMWFDFRPEVNIRNSLYQKSIVTRRHNNLQIFAQMRAHVDHAVAGNEQKVVDLQNILWGDPNHVKSYLESMRQRQQRRIEELMNGPMALSSISERTNETSSSEQPKHGVCESDSMYAMAEEMRKQKQSEEEAQKKKNAALFAGLDDDDEEQNKAIEKQQGEKERRKTAFEERRRSSIEEMNEIILQGQDYEKELHSKREELEKLEEELTDPKKLCIWSTDVKYGANNSEFGMKWKGDAVKELDKVLIAIKELERMNIPRYTENLCKFVGYDLIHSNSIFVYSDFVRGGTVGDRLELNKLAHKDEFTSMQMGYACHPQLGLDDRECQYISAKVVNGLHHLHSRGIVHGGLRASNVGINRKTGNVELMDYGLLSFRKYLNDERKRWETQHCMWLPPEFLKHGRISPQLDVWGLACLILEMHTGLPPYFGTTVRWDVATPEAVYWFLQYDSQPPMIVVNNEAKGVKHGVSASCAQMLKKMLVEKLVDRPDLMNEKNENSHWRNDSWIKQRAPLEEYERPEESESDTDSTESPDQRANRVEREAFLSVSERARRKLARKKAKADRRRNHQSPYHGKRRVHLAGGNVMPIDPTDMYNEQMRKYNQLSPLNKDKAKKESKNKASKSSMLRDKMMGIVSVTKLGMSGSSRKSSMKSGIAKAPKEAKIASTSTHDEKPEAAPEEKKQEMVFDLDATNASLDTSEADGALDFLFGRDKIFSSPENESAPGTMLPQNTSPLGTMRSSQRSSIRSTASPGGESLDRIDEDNAAENSRRDDVRGSTTLSQGAASALVERQRGSLLGSSLPTNLNAKSLTAEQYAKSLPPIGPMTAYDENSTDVQASVLYQMKVSKDFFNDSNGRYALKKGYTVPDNEDPNVLHSQGPRIKETYYQQQKMSDFTAHPDFKKDQANYLAKLKFRTVTPEVGEARSGDLARTLDDSRKGRGAGPTWIG